MGTRNSKLRSSPLLENCLHRSLREFGALPRGTTPAMLASETRTGCEASMIQESSRTESPIESSPKNVDTGLMVSLPLDADSHPKKTLSRPGKVLFGIGVTVISRASTVTGAISVADGPLMVNGKAVIQGQTSKEVSTSAGLGPSIVRGTEAVFCLEGELFVTSITTGRGSSTIIAVGTEGVCPLDSAMVTGAVHEDFIIPATNKVVTSSRNGTLLRPLMRATMSCLQTSDPVVNGQDW